MMTFEEWFEDFKNIAVAEFGFTRESVERLVPADWKPYYLDYRTPRQAWEEDFSYA